MMSKLPYPGSGPDLEYCVAFVDRLARHKLVHHLELGLRERRQQLVVLGLQTHKRGGEQVPSPSPVKSAAGMARGMG